MKLKLKNEDYDLIESWLKDPCYDLDELNPRLRVFQEIVERVGQANTVGQFEFLATLDERVDKLEKENTKLRSMIAELEHKRIADNLKRDQACETLCWSYAIAIWRTR